MKELDVWYGKCYANRWVIMFFNFNKCHVTGHDRFLEILNYPKNKNVLLLRNNEIV